MDIQQNKPKCFTGMFKKGKILVSFPRMLWIDCKQNKLQKKMYTCGNFVCLFFDLPEHLPVVRFYYQLCQSRNTINPTSTLGANSLTLLKKKRTIFLKRFFQEILPKCPKTTAMYFFYTYLTLPSLKSVHKNRYRIGPSKFNNTCIFEMTIYPFHSFFSTTDDKRFESVSFS